MSGVTSDRISSRRAGEWAPQGTSDDGCVRSSKATCGEGDERGECRYEATAGIERDELEELA